MRTPTFTRWIEEQILPQIGQIKDTSEMIQEGRLAIPVTFTTENPRADKHDLYADKTLLFQINESRYRGRYYTYHWNYQLERIHRAGHPLLVCDINTRLSPLTKGRIDKGFKYVYHLLYLEAETYIQQKLREYDRQLQNYLNCKIDLDALRIRRERLEHQCLTFCSEVSILANSTDYKRETNYRQIIDWEFQQMDVRQFGCIIDGKCVGYDFSRTTQSA